jgi:hypothetical protein
MNYLPSFLEIVVFIFLGLGLLSCLLAPCQVLVTQLIMYRELYHFRKKLKKFIYNDHANEEDTHIDIESHSLSSIVCVICLDEVLPIVQSIQLKCAHTFHQKCAYRWFRRCMRTNLPLVCPICRTEIEIDDK